MTQPPYNQQPPYTPPPSYGAAPSYQAPAAAFAPVASATDPGLNQPWYGIGFMDAVVRPFKKYADFSGRASRGEFWWFTLALFAVNVVLSILGNLGNGGGFTTFMGLVSGLVGLATLVPGIALTVRRLHDINKSGLMALVALIPLVGWIWLIILNATATYPGPTQYDNQAGAAYSPVPSFPQAPAAPAAYYPQQPPAAPAPYQAPQPPAPGYPQQ